MRQALKKHWAALAVTLLVAISAIALRLEGRVWFCKCGQLRFVVASAWSEHTSQHLFDPYSLTHLEHGVIFFWALCWLTPRASWQTRLVISTAVEAAWEIIENTPLVIDRYREATAALGYAGDSVVNSLGDILSCTLGFAVASKLGGRWPAVLLVAIEAGLLLTIRDSLLLSALMLFFPLDSFKQWQMNH
jgi:uncharacterized membrane protein YjdF